MKCVSIVIPVYNLEAYLEECLTSVVNQTYTNLEIILIDDGSKDGSLGICRKFADADDRIKVLHHENHGVSYTRNRGIETASGDYLMFVDGDDWLEPSYVEHFVDAAGVNKADIVIGNITFWGQDGIYQKKCLPEYGVFDKKLWNLICTEEQGLFGYVPNKLYRRDLLMDYNIRFSECISAQEDLDFALSAYGAGKCFELIEEDGYIYRYIPGKRNHPLLQYMKNQLKLLELAKKQAPIARNAECEVLKRLSDLVYCYLYYLPIDKEFVNNCKKLEEIPNLIDCIHAYRDSKERNLICEMLKWHRYNLLKGFFCCRHRMRQLIRGSHK